MLFFYFCLKDGLPSARQSYLLMFVMALSLVSGLLQVFFAASPPSFSPFSLYRNT